ncbi:uncharacterized protein BKA55DRAFT_516341, partial [Fusarium redolens]
ITAINALGLGVDDLNVRLVVYGGIPRQLDNFVQESGRGGRDGRKSESVVTDQGQQGQGQGLDEQEKQDEWAWDRDMIEFVEGKRCRREVLDREMDGNVDRVGCAEGEEVCDVCWEQQQQMTRNTGEAEAAEVEMEFGALSDIEEVIKETMVEWDYKKS